MLINVCTFIGVICYEEKRWNVGRHSVFKNAFKDYHLPIIMHAWTHPAHISIREGIQFCFLHSSDNFYCIFSPFLASTEIHIQLHQINICIQISLELLSLCRLELHCIAWPNQSFQGWRTSGARLSCVSSAEGHSHQHKRWRVRWKLSSGMHLRYWLSQEINRLSDWHLTLIAVFLLATGADIYGQISTPRP